MDFKPEASAESCWLAAALSSEVALLVCITEEIWSTPSVTWARAEVWFSTASTTIFICAVTLPARTLVRSRDSVTLETAWLPR